MPKNTAKPRTRTEVAEEWIGQEIFIYNTANGDEVHCLNSGAALIWLLCDGTRDVEAMASEIADAFELPSEQVLTEVQETVDHFETLQLLES